MQNSGNSDINDVYTYEINGISIKTGDLICTVDGNPSFLIGQFWWIIGKLIPGDVDHIVIYVGPGDRCVEAGAKGKVITFNVQGKKWDPQLMFEQRYIMDNLYGIADPIAGRDFTPDQENQIRLSAVKYCLQQAKEEKPYNLNFIDSDTEKAFYCSQLAYKAYKPHNINLNTNRSIPNIPFTDSIVFPQEIWAECNKKQIRIS